MYARLSKEITAEGKTTVDNTFFTDFMPFAPESYVKVYLYGLMLASSGREEENRPEEIARRLNIDVTTVTEAFEYWQASGVVSVLSTSPVAVEYLPVTKNTLALRKFSKTKYKDFNDQLHAMLPSRNILPSEYNEYYSIMEAMHIEPPAMLAIIAYSIRLKGEDVPYQYILAVARNLAHQGCLTYDRVSEQLSEFDNYDKDLLAVLKSLGSKKSPTIEDKHLFKKWTKEMGFALETVIKVAKTVKKGGMERLDSLLSRYYENRLFSIEEIESFNRSRDEMYALARNINRIIGVYYEQLDHIIETYLSRWLGYGFAEGTLLTIADYCFRKGIRSLDGMNETVEKFYRQGLISEESISSFMSEAVRRDEDIRKILDAAGVTRLITSRDRDSYRTWTYTWKMGTDVILYAASLAQGNSNPVAYVNAVLGSWHNAGVKTLEEARAFRPGESKPTDSKAEVAVTKTYSSDELNALFASLDYEEL